VMASSARRRNVKRVSVVEGIAANTKRAQNAKYAPSISLYLAFAMGVCPVC